MANFFSHLLASKGNIVKAKNSYVRERGWRGTEWYVEWNVGLAEDVEIAVQMIGAYLK